MASALHLKTRVQPGNRIELTDPQLVEGQDVDVFVVQPQSRRSQAKQTLLEFLDSLPPGPRSADSWEELERQFQEERDAWDR